MLNAFPGTLFIAKSCLLLDKHRRFVACENDVDCLQKAMWGLDGASCFLAAQQKVAFDY